MGVIGVFDSGVGGLSVLREIRRELPSETLLYVADSAYAPYGDKSAQFVIDRSHAITEFLIGQGATSLVVACNTATAAAVDSLRAAHAMPIVGIEPAIKPAVECTRANVIGVLTTSQTAISARFRRLLARFGGATRIVVQPCPGWVELVERGDIDGAETERAVAQYVQPLIDQGADVLVLGCTHYSFLAPTLRSVAGPGVQLVDPAPAVARHLRHRLEHAGLVSAASSAGDDHMWTSAAPDRIAELSGRLIRCTTNVHALPSRYMAGGPGPSVS